MNTENFGKVDIIDNWVDEDLINHLSNQFLYRYPHFFVERSTPEGKPYMYSHDCRQSMDAQGDQGNQTLIAFIETKIKKRLESEYGKLNTSRTYFNVQHPGMDGHFHVDAPLEDKSAGPTVMLMITPKGNEGEFYYKPDITDKLCIEKVEYEQNRLVVFNPLMEHYGQSFTNKPRITLVFKTYVEPN